MAKYNIHHICGHVERVDIVGTNVHGERDRKVERLEESKCRDCKRSEHDAGNIAAASKNKERGYARLEGSDRQVAWAESIRAKVIGKAEDALADPRCAEAPADQLATVRRAVEWMRAVTSSAWWIEHQETAGMDAAREVEQ